MADKIWTAAKELAASKKFQAAVLSALLWALGKLGLKLETTDLLPIVGPLWLYVFGQGLADFGKSAAQVAAKSAGPMLVLIVAIALGACSWAKGQEQIAKTATVDCTKSTAHDAVTQFAPILDALLVQATTPDGKVQWGPLEDLTKNLGAELGGCVLAEVVAHELAPQAPATGAPKAAILVLDPGSLRAGFEQIRTKRFGGATFKLDSGPL